MRRSLVVAAVATAGLVVAAPASAAPVAVDVADATVSLLPGNPRGTQQSLGVSTLERSYVRFTLTGLHGIPVQRAVLRLWTQDGSLFATTVRATLPDWSEGTMTQHTAPSWSSGPIASLPNVAAGHWVEYDVTPAVAGDGTFAFVVTGAFIDGARFAAREAGAPTAPQLVVTPMTPAQEVGAYVGDPVRATAHRFGAVDDRGVSLDGLKAIALTGGAGYLGVSHAIEGGVFHAQVVTSSDLMSWRHVRDLGEHTSQPTVAALSDGSVLLAYEREVPDPDPTVVNRSSLVIQRYADVGALLGGAPPAQEIAPARTLSDWSEGTPSIRTARLAPDIAHSEIAIDFHYLRAGSDGRQDVDRQATGVLRGFADWSTAALPALDAQFDALGVHGNLGDRDDATFRGVPVALFEGQAKRADFSTFRVYRYDRGAGGPPVLVTYRTPGGSTAFGNPTVSVLRSPAGHLAIFATAFAFGEGAAAGEGGEMLVLREVPEDAVARASARPRASRRSARSRARRAR